MAETFFAAVVAVVVVGVDTLLAENTPKQRPQHASATANNDTRETLTPKLYFTSRPKPAVSGSCSTNNKFSNGSKTVAFSLLWLISFILICDSLQLGTLNYCY